MNAQEAEDKIVSLVKQIDGVRESNHPDEKKEEMIAAIDAEIRELKKVTGPRRIVGSMGG